MLPPSESFLCWRKTRRSLLNLNLLLLEVGSSVSSTLLLMMLLKRTTEWDDAFCEADECVVVGNDFGR